MMLEIHARLNTRFRPGQRVRFKDAEAPRPPAERLRGTVVNLYLNWDGTKLTLGAVAVLWDGVNPDDEPADCFGADELGPLEILR